MNGPLMLSQTTLTTAGFLLLAVVAIESGGYYMLSIHRGRQALTGFQVAFARAGHAHAGALVILSLVVQLYVDAAGADGTLGAIAREGVPLAAILMPGRLLPLVDGRRAHQAECLHLADLCGLGLAGGGRGRARSRSAVQLTRTTLVRASRSYSDRRSRSISTLAKLASISNQTTISPRVRIWRGSCSASAKRQIRAWVSSHGTNLSDVLSTERPSVSRAPRLVTTRRPIRRLPHVAPAGDASPMTK